MVLAQALTLVESTRPEDRRLARALVSELQAATLRAARPPSHRIGLTGVPGVGKSTFLERFGTARCDEGHRVAVLAIDPTSARTGGSILGDKTRMASLARHPNAFIRPSPTGLELGGVARRTRESIVLCEAAGFGLVFVETVGVGQSEIAVASMVDAFVFLALPGAGDELQGIKRGILEHADLVVVHKADRDARSPAEEAKRTYDAALHYARARGDGWVPRTLLASSTTGDGHAEVWAALVEHRLATGTGPGLVTRRRAQEERAFWAHIDEELRASFDASRAVEQRLPKVVEELRGGTVDAGAAAERILAAYFEEAGANRCGA